MGDRGGVGPPESSELEGALNLRLQDIRPGAEVDHSQLLPEPLPVDLVVAEVIVDEPGEYGSGDCDRFSDG